jgi:phosphopantothenoylcysteine decarboxylase/phosphopantothenate--cysteine ligase
MGFALASEAHRRGARVTLVAGPTRIEPPAVDETIRVRSAAEMHAAVMESSGRADIIVMAAAVADYTPATPSSDKIAKTNAPLALRLERTPDILAELARLPSREATGLPILVGFAAETGDVVVKAREKRTRKAIDLIVANDVSRPDAGFDVGTNAVTIIGPNSETELPVQAKEAAAAAILDRVEQLIQTRAAAPLRA